LALSPTPPTALRTASTGLAPPLEPLLERDPLELWDFEPEAFGFDFAFVAFAAFLAFGFCDFAFDFGFDCDFGFDEEPARFGADPFFDLLLV